MIRILFFCISLLEVKLEEIIVDTFVGGDNRKYINDYGTNALFYNPNGVGISSNNSFVLIAEYGTNSIRKIDVVSLLVSTLAGSIYGYQDGIGTNVMFTNPVDVCITKDDEIAYILEYNSAKIRQMNISTTSVSTLVGSNSGYQDGIGTNVKFHNPFGIALSPDNSFILVSDTYNNMIRKFIISTNNVTTLVGSTIKGASDGIGLNSSFYHPKGISISPDGLYCVVADSSNHIIRKIIISTREVTTLAGNIKSSSIPVDEIGSNARFKTPDGIRISPNGLYLLITDSGFNMVRHLNISTGFVSTVSGGTSIAGTTVGISNGIGTNALFYGPHGIVISSSSSYALLADFSSHIIRKIILSQYLVSTFVGRTSLDTVIGTNVAFHYPTSISLSPDNSYGLIADSSHSLIRYVVISTGEVKSFIGRTTSGFADGFGTNAAFFSPTGISISSTGNFALVTDKNNYKIRKIIISTCIASTLAGVKYGMVNGIGTNVYFSEMYGISISSDESYALIADSVNNMIRKLIISTQVVSTLVGRITYGYNDGIGTNALFNSPYGISISPNGVFAFIGDSTNNMIRKVIISTGMVTTIAGILDFGAVDGIGTFASFNGPYGISFSSDGSYVHISDSYNNCIRKLIISTLVVTTIAGGNKSGFVDGIGTYSRFYNLRGITISNLADEFSLVVDNGNDCIRKLLIFEPSSIPTTAPFYTPNSNKDSNNLLIRESVIIPVAIGSFLFILGLIVGVYFLYFKKILQKKKFGDKSVNYVQIISTRSKVAISPNNEPS